MGKSNRRKAKRERPHSITVGDESPPGKVYQSKYPAKVACRHLASEGKVVRLWKQTQAGVWSIVSTYGLEES